MSPSGPYRLASSVAVLLASPKLGAVKRTFLLCSKGTLSLCRVSLLLPSCHYPYLARLRDRARSQRVVDDFRLLLLVPLPAPRRRARAFRPPHVPHFAPRLVEQGLNALPQKSPRTHIARFLLRPHDLRRWTVTRQQIARLPGGKRIELLHAEQRHVVRFSFLARGQQIVIDFARAEDHARDPGVVRDARVAQNFGKSAAREIR